jgi:hypothetical protein
MTMPDAHTLHAYKRISSSHQAFHFQALGTWYLALASLLVVTDSYFVCFQDIDSSLYSDASGGSPI